MAELTSRASSQRGLNLLLVVAISLLAFISPLLVILDRWFNDEPAHDFFYQWWHSVPALSQLAYPPYFALVLMCSLAVIILVWLAPGVRGRELITNVGEAPGSPPAEQRSMGRHLIVFSLAGMVLVWVLEFFFEHMPALEFGILILTFLAGWILYEVPLSAIRAEWERRRGMLGLYLLANIALVLALAGSYTPQRFTLISALIIIAGAFSVAVFARRVHPLFWIFSLALVLLTLNIDAWEFSIVGDEFAFYSYAREIVQQQDISSILGRIFWGTAVYESHPYFSSLIQAVAMKLLDAQNFGWRFGSVYVSALSLPFFYYFFKTFTSRRVAITATFLLAISHYILNFSKIGYNNTQALLAMGIALAAAAWIIRNPGLFRYAILGVALGFCFYIYPAATFVPPLALLLLLLYKPPLSKPNLMGWGLMALTLIILISPLLTQEKYWASKIIGTFLSYPSLAQDRGALLHTFAGNIVYAFFSFLYTVQESHFVTVAYADAITAALVLVGIGAKLRQAAQNKFAFFSLTGLLYLIMSVGATHGLQFPPVTRMFLLVPFFCLIAAFGLEWLISQPAIRDLPPLAIKSVMVGVLLCALALNLYQANIVSPRRTTSYQTVSELMIWLEQSLAAQDPNTRQSFVLLNDPNSVYLPNLRDVLQIYYFQAPIEEIRPLEQTAESAQNQLAAFDGIVVANPRLPAGVLSSYQDFFDNIGWPACEMQNVLGDTVTTMWAPPQRVLPCSGEPPQTISPLYTLSGSDQLSVPGTSDALSAFGILVLIVVAFVWWRGGGRLPVEVTRGWSRLVAAREGLGSPRSMPRIHPADLPSVAASSPAPEAVLSAPSDAPKADSGAPEASLPAKSEPRIEESAAPVVPAPRISINSNRADRTFSIELNLRLMIKLPSPAKTTPAARAVVPAAKGSVGTAQQDAGPNVGYVQPVPVSPQPVPKTRGVSFPRWDDVVARLPHLDPAAPIELPRLRWYVALMEWAALASVVLLFASKFLNMDPMRVPFGNEFENYAMLDLLLTKSLHTWGQLPLWNYYLRTGLPFIGDPMAHLFLPVSTIPILILGVANGYKMALSLTFVLAAIGQWLLARSLGANRIARIWTALLYAMGGQGVARIIQGQYLFLFGFAWIPFVFAGIVMGLRTREKKYYALTALALAMLFFAGNVYYAYYMAMVLGLLTLVAGLKLRGIRFEGWDWHRTLPLVATGVLALGIVAVQLLPMFQLWPNISKEGDPQLTTSQPPPEILLDLISGETNRPNVLEFLAPYDFYSYIGIVPLVVAGLALGALRRGWRKEIAAFIGLLAFVFLFIAMRYTPVAPLFQRMPILNQFRLPSRMLAYAVCAIAALGAIGITWATDGFQGTVKSVGARVTPGVRFYAAGLGRLLLLAALLYSVVDVFVVNGRFFALNDVYQEGMQIFGWLHQYDLEPHYDAVPFSTGWHFVVASNDERFWRAFYGFEFYPPVKQDKSIRPVQSRPNYIVIPIDKQPPYSARLYPFGGIEKAG